MIKNAILPTRKVGMKMSEYKYKYNAKTVQYNTQYVKDHYDRIEAKLPKGYKEKIKKYVAANNTNINVWLKELIDKELNM